jgi:iron-sulfur cluster assembly accessory protein|tara:strand:+ start:41 stop:358 length:318 start_codon:yes stop_codon:yes gene_type:complete
MIQITESAKKHLINIITTNEKKVKLGVKGGGCSGFTYDWQLIDEELSDDEKFPLDDRNNLFVDGMSLLYLAGLTIDYNTDLFGSSLKIENPNIKSACGCGESFNV